MEDLIWVIVVIAVCGGAAWIALAYLEPFIDRVGNKAKKVVLKEYSHTPAHSESPSEPVFEPGVQYLRAGVTKSVDRRGRTIYRRHGRIVSYKEAVLLEIK
jgi:hypothetical protein